MHAALAVEGHAVPVACRGVIARNGDGSPVRAVPLPEVAQVRVEVPASEQDDATARGIITEGVPETSGRNVRRLELFPAVIIELPGVPQNDLVRVQAAEEDGDAAEAVVCHRVAKSGGWRLAQDELTPREL